MNKKRLSQLLSEGWKIHMRGVIDIKDAPMPEDMIAKIMETTNNTATHILFLSQHVGGTDKIYAITEEGELKLARDEAEAGKRIIGYDPRITCGAKSLYGEMRVGTLAENIGMLTGWEVQIQEGEKEFDVFFHLEGDSKQQGYAWIEELEDVLIALSVKNRIGMEIKHIAWGQRYAAQHPFGFWTGPGEPILRKIDHDDIQRVRGLRKKGNYELLSKLAEFYGQVTEESKIIFGFSLLEDFFDEKPEHILDKAEIDSILKKAAEIDSIAGSKEKKGKLSHVLSDPSLMSKKTKNDRIAARISELMGITIDSAKKRIRKLSKLRGVAAHTTDENRQEEIKGLTEASDFMEEVLRRYLSL